jgi:hypothetical protein
MALEDLPRVKEAHLTRDENALSVAIIEERPGALWCASITAESCFFINEQGIAYEMAPPLRGLSLMRIVTPEAPQLGEELLEASLRGVLLRFADVLAREHNFTVARIVYTEDADVRFTLLSGGEIIVSSRGDFDTAYQNLISVLSSEEYTHLTTGDFEYIDLRFNPKVFVQEESVATSTRTDGVATSTETVVE